MIEIILWVVGAFAVLFFLLWRAYILGFKLGYKTGAEKVLEEWKKNIGYVEDDE